MEPSSRKRKTVAKLAPKPIVLSNKERVQFVFPFFSGQAFDAEEYPERQTVIESGSQWAHGHLWAMRKFMVDEDPLGPLGCYNLFLVQLRKPAVYAKEVYAECSFFVKGELKGQARRKMDDSNHFYGDDYRLREKYEDVTLPPYRFSPYYEGGGPTLKIDAEIQIEVDLSISNPNPCPFETQEHLLELYHNRSETADTTFVLPDGTRCLAHSMVLFNRAKHLFQLSKDLKSTDSRPQIPISEVPGEVFLSVLEYVYTVREPETKDIDTTKRILVAADRFHCTQLKLYAEWTLVKDFLTVRNAAELMHWADPLSCALLKEAAMRAFVSDPFTAKRSVEGWSSVRACNQLLEELLDFSVAHGKKYIDSDDSTDDPEVWYRSWSVGLLRKALQDRKLEIDGSREILIQRLHGFYNP